MERERKEVEKPLFWGGYWGAFAPFALFLAGVVWLGLSGAPDERGFWPVLMAALALGLWLARDKHHYAETMLKGMSQPIVALMVMAWLLAGMLASLIQAAGMVDGLVWLAAGIGMQGGGFCVASFLIACVIATATGTSLGTLLLCFPLLYPAGGALGADPLFLAGALLGGATFGDNLSPVSDTTIASASTQDADMGGVVRSRLPYAVSAMGICLLVFGLMGGDAGESAIAVPDLESGGTSLWLLIVPVLVIGLLLLGRHLIEALFIGVAATSLLALALQILEPSAFLTIDREAFIAKGLLLEGMQRGIGISVFTILLMGLTAVVEESGILAVVTRRAERGARSPRGAEIWIFGAVSAAVLVTTHAVVAMLAVGKFVKETGSRFGISPYRRANIMDLTVCIYPFILPYFIPTILAAGLSQSGKAYAMPALSSFQIGMHNAYAWCLLGVLLLSLFFRWGGKRTTGELREARQPGTAAKVD